MIAAPPHRARVTVSAILLIMGLSGCAEGPSWLPSLPGPTAPQAAATSAAPPNRDSDSIPVAQLAFGFAPQREDLIPPSPTCSRSEDWLEHASLVQGGIEEGVASWYGRRRPRRRIDGANNNGAHNSAAHNSGTKKPQAMTISASGSRFDPMALTAAHRTLPFGTLLQVTNLANGRSVVVRINDRGPQSRNRILDLSLGAAEQIEMVRAGTTRVSVRMIAFGGGAHPPLEPPPTC